jgi:YVTN family beta-propeller protein
MNMLQPIRRFSSSCIFALFGLLLSVVSFGQSPPPTHVAYVTNFNDGSISVIDTTTNTVTSTIFECDGCNPGPTGVAITPDRMFVYVANQAAGTVAIIDATSNSIVNTITIPPICSGEICNSPLTVGVAINPNPNKPFAYVTNTGSVGTTGFVTVINTQTQTIVTPSITVGSHPFGVAVTPDGAFAYVTNGAPGTENSVSVINTSTNAVTKTISVGNNPTGVAVNLGGSFAYVTNAGDGTVSVINTTTNAVTNTLSAGSAPYFVAFTPDGSRAYVTNQIPDGAVTVINTSTGTVLTTVSLGSLPTQVAVTSDGTTAYVVNASSDSVSTIDTSTNNVGDGTIAVGSSPFGIAVSPPESHTLTLGPPGTTATFTFNTDTYKLTGVTNQGSEQVTVTAFPVPKSSFPTLTGFSSETCVPYGDYSLAAGTDTCVEFQVHCQVSATDTTPCNFVYEVATGYDLPTDLSGGIGGPDFLVAHGVNCTLTSASTVQSIFLSYEATIKDPTTRGGSKGPSCFVATYTPGDAPITGTISVNGYFVGFQSPIGNPPVINDAKAGSTIPIIWQLFDAHNNAITPSNVGLTYCSNADPSTCPANTVAIKLVPIACGSIAAAGSDTVTATTSKSGLQFNPAPANSWQFNMQTSKGLTGCQLLEVSFPTGTNAQTTPGAATPVETALFRFH